MTTQGEHGAAPVFEDGDVPAPPVGRIRDVLVDGGRLIGRFVRGRASFLLAVLGASLFAASIIASAWVVGFITDDAIVPVLAEGAPNASDLARRAALLLGGVGLWKAAAITLRRNAAGWLQLSVQRDLRTELIEHQLGLSMRWFTTRSTGELLSVADDDIRTGTGVLAPLPFGTGAVVLLVGASAVVLLTDPVLGTAGLVGLFTTAWVNGFGAWQTYAGFERLQAAKGRVGAVAHESFDGALTVTALGRHDEEHARFGAVAGRLQEALIRVGTTWATYRALAQFVPAMLNLVLLTIGVLRVRDGLLTPGELIRIAYLISLLTLPIQLIGYVLWDGAASLSGWKRVERVLDEDDHVAFGALAAVGDDGPAAMTTDAVTFGYDGAPILERVDVDLRPGRTVAVVGPTASGKSTLMVLLARLWDPDRGTVHLDGHDLRDFPAGGVADRVAYVAQDTFLFDDTVRGNLTLGAPLTDDEVWAALELADAAGFVRDLPDGLDTQVGERGATLSGGQRQRIAIARAILRRPRLLLLDDATSALDPTVEARILRGLQQTDLRASVVVVAQRRASILLADEVVFLDGGRITGHGSHEDLLATVPGYAALLTAYDDEDDVAASTTGGRA